MKLTSTDDDSLIFYNGNSIIALFVNVDIAAARNEKIILDFLKKKLSRKSEITFKTEPTKQLEYLEMQIKVSLS